MPKNCMNCMRMVPTYDGMLRKGQHCQLDPDMPVNRRMCCEEWKSGDIPDRFVGALSVSSISHEKIG